MTREELIAALEALTGDESDTHTLAEGLLLGFLSKEGYGDIVRAYLGAREKLHWA
jgi:hypothetical protein